MMTADEKEREVSADADLHPCGEIDLPRSPKPAGVKLIYAEKQRRRDSIYRTEYARWIAGLSPDERARVEADGLGKPDVPRRGNGRAVQDERRHSMDGYAAAPHDVEQSDDFTAALSEAVVELLHWLALPVGQKGIDTRSIGQRMIAALWVMRPDILGNLSLTELAAIVDARPEVLSRQATIFSERFGIRGRAQFSAKARRAQSDGAKRAGTAANAKGGNFDVSRN